MRRLLSILWFAVAIGPFASAADPVTRPTTGTSRPATQSAEDAARQAAERKAAQDKADQDRFNADLASAADAAESAATDQSVLSARLQAAAVTWDIDRAYWGREAEIAAHLAENEAVLGGVPTLETLAQQQAVLAEDRRQLDEWIGDLNRRDAVLQDGRGKLATSVAAWETRYRQLADHLKARGDRRATTNAATRPATRATDATAQIVQRVGGVLQQYTELRNNYDGERDRTTQLLVVIRSTGQTVSDGLVAVTTKQREARDRLLRQDSPPLWAALLHPMDLANDVTEQGRNSLQNQWQALTGYLGRSGREMLMHTLGVLGLAGVLLWLRYRTRQWVGNDPHLLEATRVFQTPIATAITASMILTPWIYVAAPRLFWGVLGTAALVPTLVVLRPLIERSLRPLLYGLAVAIFVNLLLSIVAPLPLVYRALQLGQMGGAAVFFLWFLRTGRGNPGDPDHPPLRFKAAIVGARAGLAITAFAGLANVFGYVSLARLIGNALLTSAYLGVLLDTSVAVADALLLGISHVLPVSNLGMVQRHRPLLLKRLHLLLVVLAVGVWGFFTLESLSVRQLVFNAAEAVWFFPHKPDDFTAFVPPTPAAETTAVTTPASAETPLADAGPAKPTLVTTAAKADTLLTVGGVVSFVLSIVASIYAARFIAFLLDEDVYPRLHLARGMPYAISTLLRYLILAIGFSLAIINLGYGDPTKLTILVSAFSIGLGFGLQNIVNNFVSGLILLFERPVQVGDVIELDNVTGVVSRIGIRASIIRTPLAAEIIVPNGRLISDRVVNWTLSNRQRGVELALTVADVEPQKFIQLLCATTRALPLVASYPAPQAFFADFSGGGMRFEVRAWTNRFEDWSQVRSELAVAINAMLVKENVTLK